MLPIIIGLVWFFICTMFCLVLSIEELIRLSKQDDYTLKDVTIVAMGFFGSIGFAILFYNFISKINEVV
jgi:hypothetical protein